VPPTPLENDAFSTNPNARDHSYIENLLTEFVEASNIFAAVLIAVVFFHYSPQQLDGLAEKQECR
jgi:hypothetical protein